MNTFPDLSIAALRAQFVQGGLAPRDLVRTLRARMEDADPAIWLARTPDGLLEDLLKKLEGIDPATLPLYGIPFAIKDNIDLAGVPTTAACPAFTSTPDRHAPVVARLIEAGAVPLGKTNLDQFATGLVGVRSPGGFPANPFHPDYIPGGSSSGSAVAVALGLVSFALGTDTAGSGRVPAAFNNIVGLKPTRGLLSCRGVVPACRSLDCVSVFALSANDAGTVFEAAAHFDAEDPFARRDLPAAALPGAAFTFGVPRDDDLAFFGNAGASKRFAEAVELLESIGGASVTIDFAPFREAALLLYEGPWVAERFVVAEDLLETQPAALLPVTRAIIESGRRFSAADAFKAEYRLRALKHKTDAVYAMIDAMVTPTAGTIYTAAEVEADPVRLNTNLGYYTNFMNLLDASAVAVPAGRLDGGLPFGITLSAPAFADRQLLALAARFHAATGATMGCGPWAVPAPAPVAVESGGAPGGWVEVAVCGAHMRGLPLHHQLADRGARLVEITRTAPAYRFYALPATGGLPPRPGLVRSENGGASIEVEVWAVPQERFGTFVDGIPSPLGIGKVQLRCGRMVSGFLCEPFALAGAREITALASWRAFLAAPAS